jgi:hypothetical protein
MWKLGAGAAAASVTGVLVAAAASLGGRAGFVVTLLYATSTVLVITCATGVTVSGAARLGKCRPGRGDRPGFVEIGFLIGFFVVSPTALSGAFVILDALVGAR